MRDLLQMASELSVITVADVLAVLIARHWHLEQHAKWKYVGKRTRDLFGPPSDDKGNAADDDGLTRWAVTVTLSGLFVLGLAFAILSHIP